MKIALFNLHEWLYHYEVFIMRHGREQIFARVPSRWHAEVAAARATREYELSRQAIEWRRVRGLHPHRAATLSMCVLLLVLFIPWFWLRMSFGVVGLSVFFGLLTSGLDWMKGGTDDR